MSLYSMYIPQKTDEVNVMENISDKTHSEILKVLRAALFDESVAFDSTADWYAVFSEMYQQGVVSIPCDIFDTLPVDEKVSAKWNDVIVKHYYYNQRLLQRLGEVSECFTQNQIKWTVLKGFSAAMYYPNPFMRTIGDLDILVDIDQFDRAVELLLNLGFSRVNFEKDTDTTRHFTFEKHSIELELHRYYTLNLTRKEYAELNRTICSGLDYTERHVLENVAFNTLPPFENGLVILEHIAHHIETGVGLRHVLDFIVFANTQLTDDTLKERFVTYLNSSELRILAYTVLKFGKEYLGMQCCLDIPSEINDSICYTFTEAIFAQGDLGKKIGSEEDFNTVSVLTRSRGGIAGWWYYLQVAGEYNWAALQKHPKLKPFARFYQIGRYIRQGLSVKNPVRSLLSSYKKSRKQKELLSALGLTKHKR